ncbi:MAG: hypothetical protein KF816_02870 [Melioribacteraceae bacterium]|nr:hypothetical protein [Melioribacteraceae bacterium]
MNELIIKNYDVLIVRILQIIISFFYSYIGIVFIGLLVDGEFINPKEFIELILLFNATPLALAIVWGITAILATFFIKRSSGHKIKDSFFLKKWMSLKSWMFSLGKDFE